jgi:hypothetical protein
MISKIWWNIKKLVKSTRKKSKKIPQKFPISLLKDGEISPQKTLFLMCLSVLPLNV